MTADRLIPLAAVAGAHGVRGEVRLKLFTASVEGLSRHRQFEAAGRTLTLVWARPEKAGAIARFAEIEDRTAAELLRGTLLQVSRATLPPLGPGEYYHVDIIGRPVVDESGRPVGLVRAIENYGASDLLDIERQGGSTVMVPFVEPIVREDGDQLVVDAAFLD
jgi:16S rRNA processing protein RimM